MSFERFKRFLILVFLITVSGCGEKNALKPNILVITLDTTRADRLACYGYTRIQTPAIDSLASEGALFENAFSVQPVTLPSHASIFTGTYPFHHGVRDNNIYKLSDRNITLAEILRDNGYLTTAFLGSYILGGEFGLAQGFHFYNDRFIKPKQKGQLPVDRRASEISFLADEWLTAVQDELATRPFFLWLHYYDPHADYDPPHPYKTAYANPYDGEIAYTDDWLGYFFNSLKRRGLWDNTMVVLTADHGESLGEFGEKTHGMFIYRPSTHVPLIIKYPGIIPAGRRIQERVSSVDIMPTILDFLNLKSTDLSDGISLRKSILGKKSVPSRVIYSEVFIPRGFNWSELKGIRKGDWFFIQAPVPELYRIGLNNPESENQFNAHSDVAKSMQNDLKELLTSEDREMEEYIAVNEDMEKKLLALGYFLADEQSLSKSTDGKSLPDPKEMIELFNIYQKAMFHITSGENVQGAEALKSILEKNPDNPRFLVDYGSVLYQLGEFNEAANRLKRAIELNNTNTQAFYMLGLCLLAQGKKEEALAAFQQTIATNPNHFLACFQSGLVYTQMEQWNKAQAAFENCLLLKPDDAMLLNNLGFIEIAGRSNINEGIALIRKALLKQPDNPEILYSLGNALKNSGHYTEARKHLEKACALVPDEIRYRKELASVIRLSGTPAADGLP